MNVDQRKAELQRFFRMNLDQLNTIEDMDEKAKYLVGAVEIFFTNVYPNLQDIEDAEEIKEPDVVDLTDQIPTRLS